MQQNQIWLIKIHCFSLSSSFHVLQSRSFILGNSYLQEIINIRECITRYFFLLDVECIIILHIAPFILLILPHHSSPYPYPPLSGPKIHIYSFRVSKVRTLRRLTLLVHWTNNLNWTLTTEERLNIEHLWCCFFEK